VQLQDLKHNSRCEVKFHVRRGVENNHSNAVLRQSDIQTVCNSVYELKSKIPVATSTVSGEVEVWIGITDTPRGIDHEAEVPQSFTLFKYKFIFCVTLQ